MRRLQNGDGRVVVITPIPDIITWWEFRYVIKMMAVVENILNEIFAEIPDASEEDVECENF